jgi:hypothetical protein
MSGSLFDVISKLEKIDDVQALPMKNMTKIGVGRKFGHIEMALSNEQVQDIIQRKKTCILLIFDNDKFKYCYEEVLKENGKDKND